MADFAQRAQLLGLSPTANFAGIVTINSLDQLKEILNLTPYSPTVDQVQGNNSDDHATLVGNAVAAQVYGTTPATDADNQLIQSAFPLRVYVVSQQDMTISSQWNLTQPGGGPVIVSLGTLTVNDGGYITIANQTLDFTVDTLIRNGNAQPPSGNGLFNILGLTGDMGAIGSTPAAPGQAQNGSPGNCSSAGIAGASGGNGTVGAAGSTGGPGGPGGAGKPSLPATIRIMSAVQTQIPLSILTQSGAGGNGGTGGTGARGGQGGNGGHGATCGCTGSSGGSGAQGGAGGAGGSGGPGGNPTDASGSITVFVPSASVSQFVQIKNPAPAGLGGAGGQGGQGGAGGSAGGGGKHNDGGSAGGTGGQGTPGVNGPSGSGTGQPAAIYIQPI